MIFNKPHNNTFNDLRLYDTYNTYNDLRIY